MTDVNYKYSSVQGTYLVPCKILSKDGSNYLIQYTDPFNNFY